MLLFRILCLLLRYSFLQWPNRKVYTYIYMYTYTRTRKHTHTHTYICLKLSLEFSHSFLFSSVYLPGIKRNYAEVILGLISDYRNAHISLPVTVNEISWLLETFKQKRKYYFQRNIFLILSSENTIKSWNCRMAESEKLAR